ncbi:hypothetical protein [Rhizohabitans arisaemae]|uniref:hypothetical protein n=1 Tax=Rhizohabitans arisaemae TaxID=2720610 RepID=UPI0024B18518|nr:hypothetical protein [Rhizohabitans arisaemae]
MGLGLLLSILASLLFGFIVGAVVTRPRRWVGYGCEHRYHDLAGAPVRPRLDEAADGVGTGATR